MYRTARFVKISKMQTFLKFNYYYGKLVTKYQKVYNYTYAKRDLFYWWSAVNWYANFKHTPFFVVSGLPFFLNFMLVRKSSIDLK